MSCIQTFATLSLLGCSLVSSFSASAAPPWKPTGNVLIWTAGPTVTIDALDCGKSGYTGIVVDGVVNLVHPHPDPTNPQTIQIVCPYMVFHGGAKIQTKEALNIKISEQVAGPVAFINTRGVNGADADPTPEIWKATSQPAAADGPTGSNGRNAETDQKGNWGADGGGDGISGGHGARGVDGVQGGPGHGGNTAARIQVKVGSFADGSTILMHAIGGNGGIGGKGGRGQDGGHGGAGGDGGSGGNGNAIHNGASGGSGGNGGDGGDGGNGGQGGDGGPGGNGADVILLIRGGGQAPADLDMAADGGYGGRGGEGGDFSIGGKGGRAGQAGCGGSGGTFIWHTGGGGCGTNGMPGKDGRDGKKGPPGVFGTDGSPGNIMHEVLQYVPPPSF